MSTAEARREHLAASLNATGIVFQPCTANVGTGQIDRIQKLLNAVTVLYLKFMLYLLDSQLQIPYGIPVILQQLPSIMEQGDPLEHSHDFL
jgi:hypothetical protein